MKRLLILLVIAPFIFFSCEKNTDYRDGYEGTYVTKIVGSINFVDVGMFMPLEGDDVEIVVVKSGSEQLKLIAGGKITIVAVDKDGNFNLPTESASQIMTDPDTGISVIMNLTSSGTGTITNKALYMDEKYSGNAILNINSENYNSVISGTAVYNGKKK